MSQIKFFKGSTAPASIATGGVWFDTAEKSIKVKTATGFDVFGVGVKSASLDAGILKIVNQDNSEITVNFNDIASASSVVAALALKADKTDVEASLAEKVDKEDGKSLSTNDYTDAEKSKLAGVEADAQVNVIETVKVNGVVLTPSDKAVDVIVPAATVTGVASDDKVLSLSGTELSATLGLSYDSSSKKINLTGVSGTTIASVDASDFIKDGMVSTVSFDPDSKELTISFNTDAGKDDVVVDLADLVDTYTAGSGILISGNVVSVDTSIVATKANLDSVSKLANDTLAALGDGFSSTSTVADQLAAVKATADAAQTSAQVSAAVSAAVNALDSTSTGTGNLVVGVVQTDGVVAVTKGSAAISDVTGLQSALSAKVDNTTTVNGKALSANVVISGADVAVTGYTKGTATAITATDTVNAALGKLEAKADAAMTAGVISFADKTGAITLKASATANGSVNLAMSGNELQASIVGLGTAAYTSADAYDAAGSAAEEAATALASAKEYADDLLEWVEFN